MLIPRVPVAAAVLAVAALGCSDPATPEAEPPTELSLSDPVVVAPSDSLPSEVVSQPAHNNLDVTWHDGRLFFAFRTGPTHFADPGVVLYVVSSPDLLEWRFEGSFALETDLREPQLVSRGGTLLFYFAVLGTSFSSFDPQGVKLSEYRGPDDWSPLEDVFDEGFIPWRIHVRDDGLEVLGYVGGANIYALEEKQPIQIQWLRSDDGRAWEPVVPGQPVVLEGGGSETDLVWTDDGGIVAIVRNESGDEDGFGSKVCRASAEALGDWECVADPRKYDSPLVFRHGQQVWLIARRNVTDDGLYDLGHTEKSAEERYLDYQAAYWEKPKRCALWRVDPDTLTVEHELDLPSKGDTCFPEILDRPEGDYLVFNYTSPLDSDADPSWLDGQLGPTSIYYTVLTLP